MDSNFLTKKEAADFLRMSPRSLGRAVQSGGIAYYKGSGKTCRLRFHKADLLRFMESRKINAKE